MRNPHQPTIVPTAAERVRTVFISDVHLGSKHSQATRCLEFLRAYQPEAIYLVGDFIDGWRSNQTWNWTDDCGQVIDHLEEMMRQGTKVFYTPGNHDAFLRERDGHDQITRKLSGKLSQVQIKDEFVFESIRGWRFLITHGDLFDVVESQAQWISKLGSVAYDSVLSFNRSCNWITGRSHKNPYGLCAVMKSHVKRAIRFMSGFESALTGHAHARGCEGIICGHIHTPSIIDNQHLLYCNTGDWVENCTGLIERHDGSIQLQSTYARPMSLDLTVHPRAVDPSTKPCIGSLTPSGQMAGPDSLLEDDLIHAAST